MLTETNMHECVKRFFSQGDEASIEYVCLLLRTVGKKLDESSNKNTREEMDFYFTQMQKMISKRSTSIRLSFMLQDMMDLRKNKWVPRNVEMVPKTIDQIHREAELEIYLQQQVLKNLALPRPRPAQNENRFAAEATSSYAKSSEVGNVHLSSEKIMKSEEPSDSRSHSMVSCDTSSDSIIHIPPDLSGKDVVVVTDIYKSSVNREIKPFENETVSKAEISCEALYASELNRKTFELNEEQVKKRSKRLIEDFLDDNNIKPISNFLNELLSPDEINVFMRSTVHHVLECSIEDRYLTGKLLFQLIKENTITVDQYKKGFSGILELAKELESDIPFIWNNIGELLLPLLEDNRFSLKILKDVLYSCMPSTSAGIIVSRIFHHLVKEKGKLAVYKLWKESKLEWTDFLGDNADVDGFVRKHKIEFTLDSGAENPSPTLLAEEIEKTLD